MPFEIAPSFKVAVFRRPSSSADWEGGKEDTPAPSSLSGRSSAATAFRDKPSEKMSTVSFCSRATSTLSQADGTDAALLVVFQEKTEASELGRCSEESLGDSLSWEDSLLSHSREEASKSLGLFFEALLHLTRTAREVASQ